MIPLTLLIDMDSIVVNLLDAWIAENNRRFKDNLTISQITDWDTSKFSKGGKGVFAILDEPGFFANLNPLPGAIGGIRDLYRAGHEIILASAGTGPDSLKDKALWIQQYLPFLSIQKNLWLGHRKDLIRGDVLFDDGPSNIINYSSAWGSALIASIAYPYNSGAMDYVDFMAGDYTDTASAWKNFTLWIKYISDNE